MTADTSDDAFLSLFAAIGLIIQSRLRVFGRMKQDFHEKCFALATSPSCNFKTNPATSC